MADLTRVYLHVECEICGEIYAQQERVHQKAKWKKRCRSHRRAVNLCRGCGKEIYRTSKKCKSCAQIIRKPKVCLCCGTPISYKAKICLRCHNRFQDRGKSRERTKFQNSRPWMEVRERCFERDRYQCQRCGRSRGGVVLNAHHIKPWKSHKDGRLKLENLITLCKPCHYSVHWGCL